MSDGGAPLRLLVVAGDPVTREGLRVVLEGVGAIVVTTDGESEWQAGAGADAAVVVLDPVIKAETPVAALAVEMPAVFVGAPAALREAAQEAPRRSGFVAGPADPSRILAAVRAVLAGFSVFDEAMDSTATADGETAGEALTPREREVLLLVARGLATKEIARELRMSEHTAKYHVGQILQKLRASSRAGAVMIAARMGLIPL